MFDHDNKDQIHNLGSSINAVIDANDVDLKIVESIPMNYKLGKKLKKVPILGNLVRYLEI